MKKRFIVLCIVVLGLVLWFSSANAKEVRYFTYTLLSDGTARITGYKKESQLLSLPADTFYEASTSIEKGDLIIPSTLNGNPVSAIGQDALNELSEYNQIIIPACIKSIEGTPFHMCGNVKAFIVDDKNESFFSEEGVLFDRIHKRLIAYPLDKGDSTYTVPEHVETIEDNAFANQQHLIEVIIPSNVRSIGQYAFRGIWNLESITLSEGLISIGDYAFEFSPKVRSFTIPASVSFIGKNPFDIGSSHKIYLEPGNQTYEIRENLLIHKETQCVISLAGYIYDTYTVPDGILEIGDNAFSGSMADTIILPEGLLRIGKSAFECEEEGTTIVVPESIQDIDYCAFPISYDENAQIHFNVP